MREIICQLLGISQTSYYRWKEERAIIPLLEQYFSAEELQQYIDEGKIDKLEQLKIENSKMQDFFFKNALHKIITKGTLPLWSEEYLEKIKNLFFNPLVHSDEQEAMQLYILPLNSLLIIINSHDVKNYATLLENIKNNPAISNFKRNILINFCKYELNELEVVALLSQKASVNKYFEDEKLKENPQLNFDNLK